MRYLQLLGKQHTSGETHHLCAERGLCLDTEAFSALKDIIEKRSLERVYRYQLPAVLFLEAVGVKEGIPAGIREQKALPDSIGEVIF